MAVRTSENGLGHMKDKFGGIYRFLGLNATALRNTIQRLQGYIFGLWRKTVEDLKKRLTWYTKGHWYIHRRAMKGLQGHVHGI